MKKTGMPNVQDYNCKKFESINKMFIFKHCNRFIPYCLLNKIEIKPYTMPVKHGTRVWTVHSFQSSYPGPAFSFKVLLPFS